MDLRYQFYLSDDSKFYKLNNLQRNSTLLTIRSLPATWKIVPSADDHWQYCFTSKVSTPPQGWKIHITSRIENAQEILDIVSHILFKMNTNFKFVTSLFDLTMKNSKYGDRSGSGKFITIYPPTIEIFETLLHVLVKKLKKFPLGPYILSDNRWGESNIFYRYGAFLEMKNDNDELSILDNFGNLIPDVRNPQYHLPKFVTPPKLLLKNEQEMYANSNMGKLDNYTITNAIHFSNAGGVYEGIRKSDSKPVVIKEGRPNAGLDARGDDGFTRVTNEANCLKKLIDVENVVMYYDSFTAWEHKYLVEENIDSGQLYTWIALNYPFSMSENEQKSKTSSYRKKALTIINSLISTIDAVHAKGIGMGDMSSLNVLVDNKKLSVKLLDFEEGGPVDEIYDIGLQTPGFATPFAKTRRQADIFGIFRIAKFMFCPTYAPVDFNIENELIINEWIKEYFGTEALSIIKKLEKRTTQLIPELNYSINSSLKKLGIDDIPKITSKLRNGLIKASDIHRENLVYGDIRQHETPGGALCALTGSFGVLMALDRTGGVPSDYNFWITTHSSTDYLKNLPNGLFNGKAGIASILYDLGKKEEAVNLLNIINFSDNTEDISLYSGLSGVGLSILSIGYVANISEYVEKAKNIGKHLIKLLDTDITINSIDPDFVPVGLIDGWSGPALFFTILYRVTKEKSWLLYAEKAIEKDLEKSLIDDTNTLQVDDGDRTLPYISGGSIGIIIALNELTKHSINKRFHDIMKAVDGISNTLCCYNSGLFRGYTSFLLGNQVNNIHTHLDLHRNVPFLLNSLHIFFVEEDDCIFTPGDYGYRLSCDIFSGSSGVLVILEHLLTNNIYSWLPVNKKAINLLFLQGGDYHA